MNIKKIKIKIYFIIDFLVIIIRIIRFYIKLTILKVFFYIST